MYQVLMTSGGGPHSVSVFCCWISLSQHEQYHRKKKVLEKEVRLHDVFTTYFELWPLGLGNIIKIQCSGRGHEAELWRGLNEQKEVSKHNLITAHKKFYFL